MAKPRHEAPAAVDPAVAPVAETTPLASAAERIEVTARSTTGKIRITAGIWWPAEQWLTQPLTLEQLATCEADPFLLVEYPGKVRKSTVHHPTQIERVDHDAVVADYEKKLTEAHSARVNDLIAERSKWEAIVVSVRSENSAKIRALETRILDLEAELGRQPPRAIPPSMTARPNPNHPPTD